MANNIKLLIYTYVIIIEVIGFWIPFYVWLVLGN